MSKAKSTELKYGEVLMAREAIVNLLNNGTKMSFQLSMRMRKTFRELDEIHQDLMKERDALIATHQSKDEDGNPVLSEAGVPVFEDESVIERKWAELLAGTASVTNTFKLSDFESIAGDFSIADCAGIDALVSDL